MHWKQIAVADKGLMDEETLGVLYYEKPHPPYEPYAIPHRH